MNNLTLHSPAKINLFLQVLHKRSDGYHELASLFQTISLHDTLSFSLSSKDHLTCSDPSIPLDSSNLITKALHLFRLKTNLKFNVSIHLEKRIPMQAGLGGGSSNAATTLFALNQLFNYPLTSDEISTLGSQIGSDVAFFFSYGTAYCTGRGEIITNHSPLPPTPLFIIKPPLGLSTPKVFQNLNAADFSKKDPKQVLNTFSTSNPDYFNDLEKASFRLFPELQTLKNQLQNSGFDTVLMSGSGSAFFCIGNTKTPNNQSLTFTSKAHFINRPQNNWYQSENNLPKNPHFI